MANRATGKGYENENFYDNIKFNFLGIENIHVMRNSLSKVVDCKYCCKKNLQTMIMFI
jgi:myotubularin-related protein 6/7/8